MARTLVAAAAVWLFAFTGSCAESSDAPAQSTCTASCDGRACGDDGCGGVCGACDGADTCGADGQCTDERCAQSCEALGLACGDHCGTSCGTCGADEVCDGGACVCAPDCRDKGCGDDDGCGGICGPCAAEDNCDDCALRLHVVEREFTDGVLSAVIVALDYQPPANAPLPDIADLRLHVEGPTTLERVGFGPALVEARKTPHLDPATGEAFHRIGDDGAQRVLVLSRGSKIPARGGRWLLYRFRLGEPNAPQRTPVTISLIEREAIFAPTSADQILWNGGFGQPVVIWPETEVTDAP